MAQTMSQLRRTQKQHPPKIVLLKAITRSNGKGAVAEAFRSANAR